MNNEPVAWMDEINTFVLDKDYKQFPKSLQHGMIPLYTHPVKELTDEEIVNLINKHIDYVPDEDNGMKVIGVMDFARAILKKAQDD